MIIEKVYDEFAVNDWSYSQDNLNPVREIDMTKKLSVDELRNRALNNIEERLDYIEDLVKEEKAKIKPEEPEQQIDYMPFSQNSESSKYLTMFTNPVFDSYPELKMRVLRIQFLLGVTGFDISSLYPNFEDAIPTDYVNSIIGLDCSAFEGDYGEDDNNESNYETDDNNELDYSTDKRFLTPREIAENFYKSQLGSRKPDLAGLKNCVLKDLGWLAALLALLEIIVQIIGAVAAILGIAKKISDLAAYIGTLWVNPAWSGPATMTVTIFVTSFIIQAISLAISILYKMLDLRCLAKNALKILEDLRKWMGLITSFICNVKGAALKIANAITNNLFDSMSQIIGTVNALQKKPKTSFKDKLKGLFSGDKLKANIRVVIEQPDRQDIIDAIKGTSEVQELMQVYNEAMALKSDVQKAISSVGQNKNDSIGLAMSKMSSKFSNLKAIMPGKSTN